MPILQDLHTRTQISVLKRFYKALENIFNLNLYKGFPFNLTILCFSHVHANSIIIFQILLKCIVNTSAHDCNNHSVFVNAEEYVTLRTF